MPALGEELVFRGLLIPGRDAAPQAVGAVALSTALFVLWHPLQTLWWNEAAAVFLRPDFLAIVALLGLLCALLRRRSGSIWPGVALHWAVVVGWKGWLAG